MCGCAGNHDGKCWASGAARRDNQVGQMFGADDWQTCRVDQALDCVLRGPIWTHVRLG